jgi:hypothetical protein
MFHSERDKLEAVWREKVRQARLKYQASSEAFNATWGEHFEQRLTADPTLAIQQARRREAADLEEYMHVLKGFSDLVLQGKVPDD